MKSRRGWLLGLAAVGVIVAVVLGCWPRHGVTPENYARIKEGMTRAEVDAILGQHAVDGPEGFAGVLCDYRSEYLTLPSPLQRRTLVTVFYVQDEVVFAEIRVGGFEWWERCMKYFDF